MQPKPTITVKEARKLLGKASIALSDTQVEELLVLLKKLARSFMSSSSSKNKQGV